MGEHETEQRPQKKQGLSRNLSGLDFASYLKHVQVCDGTIDEENVNAGNNTNSTSVAPWRPLTYAHPFPPSDLSSQTLLEYTFESQGQRRTGSRHGRGGRVSEASIRKEEKFAELTWIVLAHVILNLCRTVELALEALSPCAMNDTQRLTLQKRLGFLLSKPVNQYRIDKLPGASVGISANFFGLAGSKDFTNTEWNANESHALCVWIDDNGRARCTCIGRSRFIESEGHEIVSNCSHTRAFRSFVQFIFGATAKEVDSELWKAFSLSVIELNISTVDASRPSLLHNNRTVVIPEKPTKESAQTIWVPVHVRKGARGRKGTHTTLICCFCDAVTRRGCGHRNEAQKFLNAEARNSTPVGLSEKKVNPNPYLRFENAVSQLPLTPASCSGSTRMDFRASQIAREGGTWVIQAPLSCRNCGTLRKAKVETKTGVLMSTFGACNLSVQNFKCMNTTCARMVTADGREDFIVFERVTTGITHTAMRQICEGVAFGSGTLTTRLQELLKKHVTNRNAGLRVSSVEPRTIKTLLRICVLGMHLMTKDPPVQFFKCRTCHPQMTGISTSSNNVEPERMNALCIDGIWIGSQSHLSEKFTNIATHCKPIPIGVVREGRSRPRSALIRKHTVATFLVCALKRQYTEVVESNISSACSILRLLHSNILPVGLHDREYICGRHAKDCSHDVGENSTLHRLRATLSSIFDIQSIRNNLLTSVLRFYLTCKSEFAKNQRDLLVKHLRSLANRSTCSPITTTHSELVDEINALDGGSVEAQNSVSSYRKRKRRTDMNDSASKIQWGASADKLPEFRKIHIINLLVAILEGPLPNVAKLEQLPSIRNAAKLLRQYEGASLEAKLLEHRQSRRSFLDPLRHCDILYENRLFYDGLVAIAHLDKILDEMKPRSHCVYDSASSAAAAVVEEVYECLNEFHRTYKNRTCASPREQALGRSGKGATGGSAASYAREWATFNAETLRQKFLQVASTFANKSPVSKTNDQRSGGIESVFKTGFYFPSMPQVRPLPFGIESDWNPEYFGPCTKHYEQKQGGFTPGALTFCCSCTRPVILGFKVLDKEEGPKAVLDACISRFVSMPRFLIYDFGCGLYRSAMHTLWWALKNTTVCSDAFHIVNHSCSKTFHPASYCSLDGTNTVGHEQRNASIASIKRSLRRTSRQSYIVMLAYHVLILNIRAQFRSDVEHSTMRGKDHEVDTWYFKTKKFDCFCCSKTKKDEGGAIS